MDLTLQAKVIFLNLACLNSFENYTGRNLKKTISNFIIIIRIMKIIAAVIITLNVCTLLLSCNQPKKKRLPQIHHHNTGNPYSFLWKKNIYVNTQVLSVMPLTVYKNYILSDAVFSTESKPSLLLLDVQNGQTKWSWNQINKILFIRHPFCLWENILLFNNESKYYYGLQLDDGKVIWNKILSSTEGVALLGNYFFLTGDDSVLRVGNIQSGETDTLLFIENIKRSPSSIAPDKYIGGLHCQSFSSKNGERYVVVPYALQYGYNIESHYLLYNFTKRKIVYTKQIMPATENKSGVYSTHVVKDRIIFVLSRSIICVEIKSGKKIWESTFVGSMRNPYSFISNDKIVFHCDESKPAVYALDISSGKTIWRTPDAGTMDGKFYVANNKIYYVSAGDGLLHTLDLMNGKHLWKLECPGEKENSNDYFHGGVTGTGDKIFVRSGLDLYCYKVTQ